MAMKDFLDSRYMYDKACNEFKIYEDYRRRGFYNYTAPNAEKLFFDILKTILYEVIVLKRSGFLTYLKELNEKKPQGSVIAGQYDCLVILNGFISLIKGDSESEIKNRFAHEKDLIFRGCGIKLENVSQLQNEFAISWSELQNLLNDNSPKDEKLAAVQEEAAAAKDTPEKEEPEKEEPKENEVKDPECEKRQDTLLEERRKLSAARKENDETLLIKLQDLQNQVQAELKVITDMREDINYNISIESIEQMISIYNLISGVYVYHSQNKTTSINYKVLIDNCSEFLEAVKQSLSYLGVLPIGAAKVVFDPKIHESDGKTQPTRGCVVSHVVRLGFEYKGNVVQKAIVNINR
jgi:molecular chaperone GrpE (heat shock protein)